MAKSDFSKKILNSLTGKKAMSVPEMRAVLSPEGLKTAPAKHSYAVNRSIKNLADTGLIERLEGGQGEYLRLTREGRAKASSQKLEAKSSLLNPNWDGKWRIILLDLPEARKAEREALRYLLKKAGFVCLKNSAWVSPFPFEFLFENIKKDFGLTSELMIIVTESIDSATEHVLINNFNLN